MEPKWLHPGAILENGATLEGGAVFSLIIMFRKQTAPPCEVAPFWPVLHYKARAGGAELHTMKRLQSFWLHFFFSVIKNMKIRGQPRCMCVCQIFCPVSTYMNPRQFTRECSFDHEFSFGPTSKIYHGSTPPRSPKFQNIRDRPN